jgi:hypothetical protein
MLGKFFLAAKPDPVGSAAASPKDADWGQAVIGRVEAQLSREAESLALLRDMVAEQGMQDLIHTGLLILF